ncbi:MAG: hypothetical protein ABSC54_10035 [Smithellaceae bacterium]|jgi:hypothetical protein
MDWIHKDIWKIMGKDFLVQVSRHEQERPEDLPPPGFDSEGIHRWCVYAYIYPKHSLFSRFDPQGGMFQDAARSLPLHCGVSYFEPHYYLNRKSKEIELTSFEIGADYHHIHDDEYTRMETTEQAYQVFKDAEELFEFLSKNK